MRLARTVLTFAIFLFAGTTPRAEVIALKSYAVVRLAAAPPGGTQPAPKTVAVRVAAERRKQPGKVTVSVMRGIRSAEPMSRVLWRDDKPPEVFVVASPGEVRIDLEQLEAATSLTEVLWVVVKADGFLPAEAVVGSPGLEVDLYLVERRPQTKAPPGRTAQ